MMRTDDQRGIDETPDVSGIKNREVAHELSDVSVKGIFGFGIALFALIAVVCVLMWWTFTAFEHSEKAAEPAPVSRVVGGEPRMPPEPRLQGVPGHETKPQADLRDLRQLQDAQLSSYGWVDQQAGIARIPIETAKEIILQKGIPAREPPGSKASQPSLVERGAPK